MEGQHYKGKRVLVTGADGFMGSHLVDALLAQGAIVSVFVRGNSVTGTNINRLKNLSHCQDKLASVIGGDVGNPDTISLIKNNAPEVIFHLAADAYVPKSFDQPLEVWQTNATGTLHVLEGGRACGAQRIVCTSSSEVFGHCAGSIDELTEMRPTSLYGASKCAADRVAFAHYTQFNTPVSIIRPFNTYGPRHTYDVIPYFIKLALDGKDLTVHGDGTQTRDFSFVSDTVEGFLLMGSHPDAIGRAVNFGTGIDTTVNDVAKAIQQHIGGIEITHGDARMAEVQKMRCNPSLAKELFGWEAKVSISEGIRKNIEHVKATTRKKELV